jgi:hypothetical protein
MPKRYHHQAQANQYDKIFRENMEAALPGIIEHLLGLDIVHSEEIPDDIQHTKERKPDLLKKVTDSSGKVFILHLEYQVANENEMVYRMAECCYENIHCPLSNLYFLWARDERECRQKLMKIISNSIIG